MQPLERTSQGIFSALTAGLHVDTHKANSDLSAIDAHASAEMAEGASDDAHAGPEMVAGISNDPFEAANLLRKGHGIRVTGGQAPAPLVSFGDLSSRYKCSKRLMAKLEEHGWHEPTAIQRQAIPILLDGRDLFAVAPTGHLKSSTKRSKPSEVSSTLQIASKAANSTSERLKGKPGKADSCVERSKGPSAVILAPSRELAAQTARCLLLLLKGLKLRCTLLTAAVAAGTDFSKFLILDEADKLFEQGFVSHIDRIILACSNPDIVRGLFSATLPEGVEELASSVLQSPLRLVVGPRNAPTSAVSQRLLFVGSEGGKILGLRQLIAKALTPPVLLFVSSKERAEAVHRQVMYDGVHADVIHSSQPQSVRNAAVDRFRSGASWLLVATDLVGRGMDFLGVHTVINYDFPQSTTDYIQGWAEQAGLADQAITFYTEDDAWQLRSVVNVMRAAGCEVPDWMLHLKKERRKSHTKKDNKAMGKVGKQSVTALKAARR
ncbi:MAG: DEAD-box ATP-dependent RNA helicase 57 [Trebouxia sp. A1-2]|nr:MAG: DEAD-box ATP-dependent RNA helicase 57 [Trebouxia sp. A1-2]